MNLENENLIAAAGMTSVSALISAIESGVNNRKIRRVILTPDAAAKKRRELSFLRHKSALLGYDISVVSEAELDAAAGGSTHGGIVALATERVFAEISAGDIPNNGFFVLLEGIEDPYNFGYTLRSLWAAGADGIILDTRNWMSAATTVMRSSAGASELFRTYAGDTVEAVRKFKLAGYRIVSAGIRNSVSLYEADLSLPLLLIIGGEKRGISRTLLDLSDLVVRIDYGRKFLGSLTTASSAAVIAFEVMRKNTGLTL